MGDTPDARWWRAGVGWSLTALALVLVASTLVPLAAEASRAPLLSAMAAHAGYVYAAAGIMVLVGWIDSFMMYRRAQHRLMTSRPQA